MKKESELNVRGIRMEMQFGELDLKYLIPLTAEPTWLSILIKIQGLILISAL